MSTPSKTVLSFSAVPYLRLPAEEAIDSLFTRMVEDDYDAFEKLFHLCYRCLCSYSRQLVICSHLAEEIVDDVLFSLWCNRRKIRITTSFRAYLVKCVRNRSLDSLRRKKGVRIYMLDHAAAMECKQSIAHDVLIVDELQRQIEGVIDRLPSQCQTIFRLSREEDLSYKEIALRLNISVKTVDTQICRALRVIRRTIAAQD